MKKHFLPLLAVCTLSTTAFTQISPDLWTDDFSSYTPGQMTATPPQGNPITSGGWDGWDGDPNVLGTVVPNPTDASDQSLEILANTDHLWHFQNNLLPNGHDLATSTWVFEIDCYVPSTSGGRSWYIIQNIYNHFGPYNWSVQIAIDMNTAMINADYGSGQCAQAPLPLDEWFRFRSEVYTNVDVEDPANPGTFINGGWTRTWILRPNSASPDVLLQTCPNRTAHPRLGEGYIWTYGVFGAATNAGANALGNLDLYGDPSQTGPVYYDNPRLFEKPDFFKVATVPPLTGASGLPRIDAANGGTLLMQVNGTYKDAGGFLLIVCSWAGNGPFPNPFGAGTLPITPDPVLVYFLENLTQLGAVGTAGPYGERASAFTLPMPAFPPLVGTSQVMWFAGMDFNFVNAPNLISWSVSQGVEFN